MSVDATAKLFYGYTQPEDDKARWETRDQNEDDTPWSAMHIKEAHGCVGGIHGMDEELGFFLAVKESLHEAGWDAVVEFAPHDFIVQPTWNEQLQVAAETFGLNTAELVPHWYLVCLYF